MAVALDDFLIDYPEFEARDLEQVERALTRAALRISEEGLGDLYDEAQGLLAADILSSSSYADASDGGAIASISVQGEGSVSFNKPDSSKGGGSIYRQRYEQLLRSANVFVRII